jgi:uncharacterized protein
MMKNRMVSWAHAAIPKREVMERNRFIRPFAMRPELWRLHRRSVPRGVAIGLLIGIFVLVPGLQIVGAALLCVPFRGNIPIAAAMTFLSNPFTTPLIIAAALWIGSSFGFHADLATFQGLVAKGASLGEWATWMVSDAAPSLVFGLLMISVVSAVIGYIVAVISWRIWTGAKRRGRIAQVAANQHAANQPATSQSASE